MKGSRAQARFAPCLRISLPARVGASPRLAPRKPANNYLRRLHAKDVMRVQYSCIGDLDLTEVLDLIGLLAAECVAGGRRFCPANGRLKGGSGASPHLGAPLRTFTGPFTRLPNKARSMDGGDVESWHGPCERMTQGGNHAG
jgi:hypothetical protein